MVVTRAVLIETERKKLTGDGQGRRKEPHVSVDRVARYRVPRELEQGRQEQAEARHGRVAGGRWQVALRDCLGIGSTVYNEWVDIFSVELCVSWLPHACTCGCCCALM